MNISFVRGNVVQFATSFFDADGGVVTPVSAAVTITTAPYGGADSVTAVLSMTDTDGEWIAEWDTTGIAGGIVYWAVKATSPHAADEGSFNLDVNLANT